MRMSKDEQRKVNDHASEILMGDNDDLPTKSESR